MEKQYQDTKIKSKDGTKIGRIIRPYHIYTRVVDSNTEIDKNADLNDVEYLWRKRFGIDRSPKERLMILLDDILIEAIKNMPIIVIFRSINLCNLRICIWNGGCLQYSIHI